MRRSALRTRFCAPVKSNHKGFIVLELPRLESGQGIATACAMMVAEEFDVPLSQVDIPLSDGRPELVYNQITGGSAAVRCFDAALPVMAAAARARLLAAAAQQWGVSASMRRVEAGVIIAPDGRTTTYGSCDQASSKSQNAAMPVCARPKMSAWMSCVPS